MHYVLHITRARVVRVYFLYKICALRNNASLLRMLKDVGDSRALGLAGLRLASNLENRRRKATQAGGLARWAMLCPLARGDLWTVCSPMVATIANKRGE